MTVSTTSSVVTLLGNGSTLSFNFPFIADQPSDIEVILTNLNGVQSTLSPSVYTLLINTPPPGGLWGIGGSVTYPNTGSPPSPIQVGESITINRIVPYEQNVSIGNQGAFYPQAVEQGLDVLELQIQQIRTDYDYTLKAPLTDVTPPADLPPAAERAGLLLGFDSTGEIPTMYPQGTPGPPGPPGPFDAVTVNLTSANSPYTVTTANVIYADASGGSVIIHIPSAASQSLIFIIRTDNTYGNVVEFLPQSGQTINGTSGGVLQFQNAGVTLVSNGSTKWEYAGQNRTNLNPLTQGYKSWTNIFDVIADPFIATSIQNGTHFGNVDSYVATAIAGGGEIYFPAGTYFFGGTVNMAPGVVFRGAGMGNTNFFISGATVTDWGIQQLNSNGIDQIEGFKLYDISFNLSSNGIRWNSVTGGFTNDGTSQDYMVRPHIERCQILNDVARPNNIIGVQMNKCFDGVIEDCDFEGMGYGADMEGTDISRITHNRFNAMSNAAIAVTSHNSFGSQTRIEHNDILSPGNDGSPTGNVTASALITSDLDGYFCENYIEGFATVNNAIQVMGGFNHKMNDNRIQWALATNVLNVRDSGSDSQVLYGLEFCNNHTTGLMGEIIWERGFGYYWSNSDNRCYLRVRDNTVRNVFVPMLSQQSDVYPTDINAAIFTAGRPGVAFTGIGASLQCQTGDFSLPANSDTSLYMELSNYENYPGSLLTGTFTIYSRTYSQNAGGTLNWAILDNATPVTTGTITHTNANQIYPIPLISSHAFTSKPTIRFWNADTGTGGTQFIRAVIVAFA